MGFFGSMKSIQSIYERLNKIEPKFISMIDADARGDSHGSKLLAIEINTELFNLTTEVNSAPNSVQCAEFRFLGSDYPIYHIIKGLREAIQPCLHNL